MNICGGVPSQRTSRVNWVKELFRLDLSAQMFGDKLTTWIAVASLPLLLVQLVLNYTRGTGPTGMLVSGLALLSMAFIALLTRVGQPRAARILLPTFGLVAANAFLFTSDELTPMLFVANNATVILLAGAVLGPGWILAFALTAILIAIGASLGNPSIWQVGFSPPSHTWEAAAPLFLFTVLFIFMTTWQRTAAGKDAEGREAELDTLLEASGIVTASLDLDETIERILQQLARVVPFDSTSVQVLGDGYLEIIGGRGWQNMDDVLGLRFPIPADNPNTIVVEKGQPYILNNAPQEHAEFLKEPHSHIRSWLGVPLRIGDRVMGMLSVDSSLPDRYGDREANLALAFADAVAIALENARHFEAEQRRRQLGAMQFEIIRVAGSSLEIEPLLDQIAVLTSQATQAALSTVFVTTADGSQMDLASFHIPAFGEERANKTAQEALQQLGNSSILRQALGQPQTTVLDHESTARALPADLVGIGELNELLLSPLSAREGVLGALMLATGNGKESFDPEEITLIETISHSVAACIENARLYSQTEQMAITDSLTGIYNRRGLFQFGQREVERSLRFARTISVLMVDLDHFKRLNDTYGHVVGDQVLASVAGRLNESVRRIDVVGRYGGEEFLVLLPECELQFARGVAERIRLAVERDPISSTSGPIPVTVSVGVASSEQSPLELEALVRFADQALYGAKQAGRNQVRTWDPDLSGTSASSDR